MIPNYLRAVSAVCLTSASLLIGAATANAAVIIAYDADSAATAPNPTTVGWATGNPDFIPQGYSSGSETTYPGAGNNYLRITNAAGTASGSGVLTYALAPEDVSDPEGWTMTAVARVVNARANNLFSSYIRVFANGREHRLSFINGNFDNTPGQHYEGLVVRRANGSNTDGSYLTSMYEMELDQAYLTFQIYYNPNGTGNVATTSILVNGVLIDEIASSTLTSQGSSPSGIEWGRATAWAGDVHWSQVRFESGFAAIPEPSTFALMGAGLVGVALLRRKAARRG